MINSPKKTILVAILITICVIFMVFYYPVDVIKSVSNSDRLILNDFEIFDDTVQEDIYSILSKYKMRKVIGTYEPYPQFDHKYLIDVPILDSVPLHIILGPENKVYSTTNDWFHYRVVDYNSLDKELSEYFEYKEMNVSRYLSDSEKVSDYLKNEGYGSYRIVKNIRMEEYAFILARANKDDEKVYCLIMLDDNQIQTEIVQVSDKQDIREVVTYILDINGKTQQFSAVFGNTASLLEVHETNTIKGEVYAYNKEAGILGVVMEHGSKYWISIPYNLNVPYYKGAAGYVVEALYTGELLNSSFREYSGIELVDILQWAEIERPVSVILE